MPTTILFISAIPPGTNHLESDDECRAIDDERKRSPSRDAFTLAAMPAARIEDLRRGMMQHTPEIVHFSGHGRRASDRAPFDNERNLTLDAPGGPSDHPGELVVRDDAGNIVPIPVAATAQMFRIHQGRTRLVVLSACHTGDLANAIAHHIDCVIGTTGALPDLAAVAFSRGFYAAVFAGNSVRAAFEIGQNEIQLTRSGDPQLLILRCRDGIDPDSVHLGEMLGPLTFHVLLNLALHGDDLEPPPADALGNLARRLLITLRDSLVTWELYVAAVALEYAPRVLERHAPAHATTLGSALSSFLREVTEVRRNIPSPVQLFVARDPSAHRISTFLAALFDDRAILDVKGVREGLKAAADEIVRVLFDNEPYVVRQQLLATARFLARLESRPPDSRLKIPKRIVAKLVASKYVGSLDANSTLTLDLHDGELEFLTETMPKAVADNQLEQLAAYYDKEFSEKKLDQIPLFTALYIEPRVVDDSTQGADLFEYVDRWLESAPRVPLVLMGDPGSGKTTACQAIVHRQLDRVRRHAFSDQVAFPILLPLRLLRHDCAVLGMKLSYELAQALYNICLDQVRQLLGSEAQAIMPDRRFLFVLDGFDELALIDETMQGFLHAVGRLPQDKPWISIILTGRTFALASHSARMNMNAGVFPQNRWKWVTIQPFTLGPNGEVERFVLSYVIAAKRDKVSADVLNLVAPDAQFSDVAQTPVLLTMLCVFYHRIDELRVADEHKVARISVLKWLVDQAVRWRANPRSQDRERLSDDETQRRLTTFQGWAWEAFRRGGTEFTVNATTVVNDAWLVEFFVKPVDGNPGNAAFVHRTIAEFLAATHLVHSVCQSTRITPCDMLLQYCQELATDRLLDEHFKKLIGQAVTVLPDPLRDLLKEAAAQLVKLTYERPHALRWAEIPSPLLDTLAMIAELSCTMLLGSGRGEIDSKVFLLAARLRTASPRGQQPWHLGTAIRSLAELDLRRVQLPGLDLSQADIAHVEFSSLSLFASSLRGGILRRCAFGGRLPAVDLRETAFIDCKFTGVNFKDAQLTDTLFIDCVFLDGDSLAESLESLAGHGVWISLDQHNAAALDDARTARSPRRTWLQEPRWVSTDGVAWDYGVAWSHDAARKVFLCQRTADATIPVAQGRSRAFRMQVELVHRGATCELTVEIFEGSGADSKVMRIAVELRGTVLRGELQPHLETLDKILAMSPHPPDDQVDRSETMGAVLMSHVAGVVNDEIQRRTNPRFLALRRTSWPPT